MIKLLAVDDEKGITDTLCKYFRGLGFNIKSANTADEALDAIKSDRPDIVFLDITLGAVSGLDILKKIKATDKRIRVIMLTVHGKKELIDKSRELGAEKYIRKPFSMDDLEEVVVGMVGEILNEKSSKK